MNPNSNHRKSEDILLYFLILLPVTWLALKLAPVLVDGMNLESLLDGLNNILANPMRLIWTDNSLRFLLLFVGTYTVGYLAYVTSRRNTMPQKEYGSAQWGEVRKINARYAQKPADQNLIFTEHLRLGLNSHKHRRNLNVLVIGGSGAGKTRFYAMPNLMQCNTSFVITDPKGELLRSTGWLMWKNGYQVKVLDLINMPASHGYNPFEYIQSDNDVLKLVTNLIKNTTPKHASSSDPFWEKSETALLQALILYLYHEAAPEEQNFGMVMKFLRHMEIRENDPNFKNAVDKMFDVLENKDPDHVALKQYRIYKMAAGKTAKSILISAGVRLAAFNLEQVVKLTQVDEMDIHSIGEEPTALYCCIPDSDTSFNFIVGMLYSQIFQTLYNLADREYGGRLPVHTHFLMDEFANVALPDDFEKLLATMRSREISVSIILQNLAQLKALFKDTWESIAGNCDTLLYLGGNEVSTHEYIVKMLGKSTIDTTTHGRSHGRNGNYSDNFQQTGRELMTVDEVRMLDNRYAMVFLRGERAVLDLKTDLTKHPNAKRTTAAGGQPYDHAEADFGSCSIDIDLSRMDDYALYDLEDEEDRSQLIPDEEIEEEME